MKRCSKCGIEKEDNAFAWKSKVTGTRQGQCDPCRKATAKQSYNRNKRAIIRKTVERNTANQEWYREFKRAHACVACGENTPECLDFHHLNSNEKDLDPSLAFRQMGRQRFLSEISKCVCLCANCHRKVHAQLLCISP